jgi:hypothetical protein
VSMIWSALFDVSPSALIIFFIQVCEWAIVGVTCEDYNYFFRFRSCSRFIFIFICLVLYLFLFWVVFVSKGKLSQEELVSFVSLEALAKRNSFRGCQRAGGLLLLVRVSVQKWFEKCVLRRTIDGFQ